MKFERRLAPKDSPDFFPTPKCATKALLAYERFDGNVLEPACGKGDISKVFLEKGFVVDSSDLFDWGFGKTGQDFFDIKKPYDNIVTNPPFNRSLDFAKHSLEIAQRKVALLLRLSFLEGMERYQTLFTVCPPSKVYVFSKRLTFYPEKITKGGGSGPTAYAWFVWDKTTVCDESVLKWIRPELVTND